MKGVILGISPDVTLVDISHLVLPGDIRSGAFVLLTSYYCFPRDTINLAVIDPGVGTSRRAIAVRTSSHYFVGPDNGIFSLVLAREKAWEARSLENPDLHRKPVSSTFHGRDIFASVAAHLAAGTSFDLVGPPCSPVSCEWSVPVVSPKTIRGEVIHIDSFGNAITNVTQELLNEQFPLEKWRAGAGKFSDIPILRTYGLSRPGSIISLAGSSGFMEIAVNEGDAASLLGLVAGSPVWFSIGEEEVT